MCSSCIKYDKYKIIKKSFNQINKNFNQKCHNMLLEHFENKFLVSNYLTKSMENH